MLQTIGFINQNNVVGAFLLIIFTAILKVLTRKLLKPCFYEMLVGFNIIEFVCNKTINERKNAWHDKRMRETCQELF